LAGWSGGLHFLGLTCIKFFLQDHFDIGLIGYIDGIGSYFQLLEHVHGQPDQDAPCPLFEVEEFDSSGLVEVNVEVP